MKNDEEIGVEAASNARLKTLEAAKKQGVTLSRTMLRLKQSMDAKETKFFQKDGVVVTEKDVIAHQIRLRAVEISLNILDAMPSEKHDHNLKVGESTMTRMVQALQKIKKNEK